MDVVDTLLKALGQVLATLQHNWPFLTVSVLVGAAMNLYLDKEAVAAFLRRHEKGGVLAATAAAVGTPLCSCGTTAIVLGMMAGSMPWAPIIAFMVASPLTSPEELFYSAGLFGWPFAVAFFVASIVLGLGGGIAATFLDARGWLRNQGRFAAAAVSCQCSAAAQKQGAAARPAPVSVALTLTAAWSAATPVPTSLLQTASAAKAGKVGCGCETGLPLFALEPASCGCGAPAAALVSSDPVGVRYLPDVGATLQRLRPLLREVLHTGRRLLVTFLGFAFLGYLINDLIPAGWITALFGSGHAYSVPLASTLGLPFYINSEATLPLVRGMLDSGMSAGAALAFLITGAGTSIGAVAGAITIARWRVIGVVIVTLWAGAVLCGLAYDGLLAAGLF